MRDRNRTVIKGYRGGLKKEEEPSDYGAKYSRTWSTSRHNGKWTSLPKIERWGYIQISCVLGLLSGAFLSYGDQPLYFHHLAAIYGKLL